MAEDPRQPAYDAVFAYLRSSPSHAGGVYDQAVENARVWRAVERALDAMDVPKVLASDRYPNGSTMPVVFEDEFQPYLAEALKDPAVKAAYEAEMGTATDPSEVPGE